MRLSLRTQSLAFVTMLALAGCLSAPITDPLVGEALDARLIGQNLEMTAESPELGHTS